MNTAPLVIIGSGLAGWTTAREFRKLNPTGQVHLITADAGDFYAKPSLSNAYAQHREPAQLVTTSAQRMADTLGVTLLARTRVTGIDVAGHTVHTDAGEVPYSQLVLATGAQPIRVPVAGDAAAVVLSVNSLDDFAAFHARLGAVQNADTPRHVVIMGAGLIGCEFANDLMGAGYTVTVVDPSTSPIAALLPAGLSTALRDTLAQRGVVWHFSTTVAHVDHAPDQAQPLRVTLANGVVLPADVVLSAVGLRADVALAQAAGLDCARGVVVNELLQTSAPDVYALGDAAQYAFGRTLPYVMPIMHAAKALAATLAGQPTEVVFPLMPVAIKTPAFPLVVAAPAPGTPGQWVEDAPGGWVFMDDQQAIKGFALGGAHTNRRAELAKRVV